MSNDAHAQRICELNDEFRKRGVGGQTVYTHGISSLGLPEVYRIRRLVAFFNDFEPDNDPHREHDFGALDDDKAGKIFWMIDYYDNSCLTDGRPAGRARNNLRSQTRSPVRAFTTSTRSRAAGRSMARPAVDPLRREAARERRGPLSPGCQTRRACSLLRLQ